jgi:hypothetical protein
VSHVGRGLFGAAAAPLLFTTLEMFARYGQSTDDSPYCRGKIIFEKRCRSTTRSLTNTSSQKRELRFVALLGDY